jgi:hypothetical protein
MGFETTNPQGNCTDARSVIFVSFEFEFVVLSKELTVIERREGDNPPYTPVSVFVPHRRFWPRQRVRPNAERSSLLAAPDVFSSRAAAGFG